LRLVPAADGRVGRLDAGVRPPTDHRGIALPFSSYEIVVALIAAVVAIAVAIAIGHGAFSAMAPAPPGRNASPGSAALRGATAEVVVAPGDTLWSIARSIQPAGDLRDLVGALQAANGGSASLQPGDRLTVPH